MFNWELKDDALKTWIRLRQASEVMEKVLETALDRQGSTLTQVDVLSILDASKTALTPGEIADYTFRQQHSASAQLSRMWRSGLVKKTRSRVDQRVVHIKATPKGQELLKQARAAGAGQARKLLTSALSENEMKQLDRLLRKVRDHAMEKLEMKAKPLPDSFDAERFEADLG